MAKNVKWTFMVTLCSLLLGVLLMFQLKAQARASANGTSGPENVISALAPYTLEIEQLQTGNDKLQQELNQYIKGAEASQLAQERLQRAQLQAGLTQVQGPGIRITLDDSKREITNRDDENKYIIHEGYLRELVNALWNNKAEAIAINGQRITSASEIFCTGTVIKINGEVLTPPYVIDAIGDSQKMAKGIEFVVKFVLSLDQVAEDFGITVYDEPVTLVRIPAARLPNYKFATPVKGGS